MRTYWSCLHWNITKQLPAHTHWASNFTSSALLLNMSRVGAPGWHSRLSIRLQPGHDLAVREFEPRVRLWADGSEPGACFRFCVSLSLCPSPVHALSLSVPKINKRWKKKLKKISCFPVTHYAIEIGNILHMLFTLFKYLNTRRRTLVLWFVLLRFKFIVEWVSQERINQFDSTISLLPWKHYSVNIFKNVIAPSGEMTTM